ncbi:hypothetical protein [Arenibaculum sp.]|jgi:hypothetical protein|nr:hypothetical protein [Arenibaculum sp.]
MIEALRKEGFVVQSRIPEGRLQAVGKLPAGGTATRTSGVASI